MKRGAPSDTLASPKRQRPTDGNLHPLLISKPKLCTEYHDYVMAVGPSGTLITCNLDVKSPQTPGFSGCALYQPESDEPTRDPDAYQYFARMALWGLPRYMGANVGVEPTRLVLKTLDFAADGHVTLGGMQGQTTIYIRARGEAAIPFVSLRILDFSPQGWVVTFGPQLTELQSLSDFRLERA